MHELNLLVGKSITVECTFGGGNAITRKLDVALYKHLFHIHQVTADSSSHFLCEPMQLPSLRTYQMAYSLVSPLAQDSVLLALTRTLKQKL